MSTTYHAVHWNRQKRIYDGVILALALSALATFSALTVVLYPEATVETLIMRGTAFLALFLIQIVLCIGPLARLSPRFLPLLYNRRHLGVTIFLVASVHAAIAIIQHHVLGDTFPLISVFTSYAADIQKVFTDFSGIRNIPFEPFGALALVILYLMAVTSHDFWLRLLGASTWKLLHMLVYVAYGALLVHVSLGFLQSELSIVYPLFIYTGFFLVVILHLLASFRGRRDDASPAKPQPEDGFLDACAIDSVREGWGTAVRLGKRKVALYRSEGRIFALSGVCRHQGGPIGEGRLLDGCVTCPWHGWQYKPETGDSPPPFNEHIPTYPVELRAGRVFVNPVANPRGTVAEGVSVADTSASLEHGGTPREEFYIGYLKSAPPGIQVALNATGLFLLMACPLLMALAAAAQSGFDYGRFEFGSHYALEGVFYEAPVPALYIAPKSIEKGVPGQNILLCSPGKFGIPESWAKIDGQRVQIAGSLVYRDEIVMLEVADTAIPEVLSAPNAHERRPKTIELGPVNLVGELVDTKCFLGVMRPATGKVHRACAIRCLSGGIPPSILVKSGDHDTAILLTGPAGEALQYDVVLAGLQVRVAGTLYRENGFDYIRVESLHNYADEPRQVD